MSAIDPDGSVRDGETLNLAQLDPWLKARLPHLKGQPSVTQYSGGVSNWTYRLAYESDDLVLRRPPSGTKARSSHDMGREFRLQQALRPHFPLVPQMKVYSDDNSIIGAEFYVMERVVGVIPRRNLPREIVLLRSEARSLSTSVVETLAHLHQVDTDAAGLNTFGTGRGYARRQVEGWSRRWRDARTWNVPSGERVMAWLADNLPQQEHVCLTHNDFRLDNLVLDPNDPTRIIAVLDWELAALGDPLMDLGNMLAYWVQADDDLFARSARRQPTHLPGMLTRAEVLEHYFGRTGLRPERWAFYEVFGMFRLSVIAQQIYFRYHRRETRNPAFRHFWVMVHYLHWRCHRAIKRAL